MLKRRFIFFYCLYKFYAMCNICWLTQIFRLGEHPMAVAAMYSFLLDRHQASDIDGAFTLNLLKVSSPS